MRMSKIWYREQSDMLYIRGPLARRVAMPTPFAPHIILSQKARTELQALVRASSTPQSLGLRARIVLRAADTDTPTNLHIGHDLGCCNRTVGKWRRRYLALGLSGLQDAIRPGRPRTAVYLSPADKYHRLTRRLLQDQKVLEERA